MKTIFLIIFFILDSILTRAQCETTILIGTVSHLNSHHSPLFPVNVHALGANNQDNESDGHFTLTFCNIPAGTRVSIDLNYKDWIIANAETTVLLSNNPTKDTFKLYMCPADELDAARAKLYNQGYFKIKINAEKKIAALDKKNKEYANQFKLINEELEKAKKDIAEIADKYSRIDYDDLSSVEQTFLIEFTKGNYQEAVNILNTTDLRRRISKTNTDIKIKNKIIKDANQDILEDKKEKQTNARIAMEKVDAYKMLLKKDSVRTAYEEAIEADSSNSTNIALYADFLTSYKDFKHALPTYQQALKNATSIEDSCHIFYSLAILFADIRNYPEAELNFRKSIAQATQLYDNRQISAVANLATICFNFGKYFRDTNHYDSSVVYYHYSAYLYEQLSKVDSALYLPELGYNYSQIAGVYKAEAELDSLHSYSQKALRILSNFKSSKDQTVLVYVSGCYDQVAKYFMEDDSKNLDSALFYNNEAFNIWDSLNSEGSEIYSESLIEEENTAGKIYALKGEFSVAKQYYQKGITRAESLMAIDPYLSKPYLVFLYSNLGDLYTRQHFYIQAKTPLLSALSIAEDLYLNDSTSIGELPRVCTHLAIAYGNIPDDSAEYYFIKSITLYKEITKKYPRSYEVFLTEAETYYGIYLYNYGDIKKSRIHLSEALEIIKTNGPKFQFYIDQIQHYLNLIDKR